MTKAMICPWLAQVYAIATLLTPMTIAAHDCKALYRLEWLSSMQGKGQKPLLFIGKKVKNPCFHAKKWAKSLARHAKKGSKSPAMPHAMWQKSLPPITLCDKNPFPSSQIFTKTPNLAPKFSQKPLRPPLFSHPPHSGFINILLSNYIFPQKPLFHQISSRPIPFDWQISIISTWPASINPFPLNFLFFIAYHNSDNNNYYSYYSYYSSRYSWNSN